MNRDEVLLTKKSTKPLSAIITAQGKEHKLFFLANVTNLFFYFVCARCKDAITLIHLSASRWEKVKTDRRTVKMQRWMKCKDVKVDSAANKQCYKYRVTLRSRKMREHDGLGTRSHFCEGALLRCSVSRCISIFVRACIQAACLCGV